MVSREFNDELRIASGFRANFRIDSIDSWRNEEHEKITAFPMRFWVSIKILNWFNPVSNVFNDKNLDFKKNSRGALNSTQIVDLFLNSLSRGIHFIEIPCSKMKLS